MVHAVAPAHHSAHFWTRRGSSSPRRALLETGWGTLPMVRAAVAQPAHVAAGVPVLRCRVRDDRRHVLLEAILVAAAAGVTALRLNRGLLKPVGPNDYGWS